MREIESLPAIQSQEPKPPKGLDGRRPLGFGAFGTGPQLLSAINTVDLRAPRKHPSAMAGKGEDSPAMKQYRELKDQHAGALLLYQMGDFF